MTDPGCTPGPRAAEVKRSSRSWKHHGAGGVPGTRSSSPSEKTVLGLGFPGSAQVTQGRFGEQRRKHREPREGADRLSAECRVRAAGDAAGQEKHA